MVVCPVWLPGKLVVLPDELSLTHTLFLRNTANSTEFLSDTECSRTAESSSQTLSALEQQRVPLRH